MPMPALPKVPSAAGWNAAAFRYLSQLPLSATGSTPGTTSGRSKEKPLFWSELPGPQPAVVVPGRPERTVTISLTFQPPSSACVTSPQSLPTARSLPIGSS